MSLIVICTVFFFFCLRLLCSLYSVHCTHAWSMLVADAIRSHSHIHKCRKQWPKPKKFVIVFYFRFVLDRMNILSDRILHANNSTAEQKSTLSKACMNHLAERWFHGILSIYYTIFFFYWLLLGNGIKILCIQLIRSVRAIDMHLRLLSAGPVNEVRSSTRVWIDWLIPLYGYL